MKKNKIIFFIIGIIMLINTILFNLASLDEGKFPEGIIFLAITIMSFSLSYLVEHVSIKDERAKKIRERSIFISYFWVLIFILILLTLINPYIGIVTITAYHLLLLFITFYISIVFLSMVYYARKL